MRTMRTRMKMRRMIGGVLPGVVFQIVEYLGSFSYLGWNASSPEILWGRGGHPAQRVE